MDIAGLILKFKNPKMTAIIGLIKLKKQYGKYAKVATPRVLAI